MTAAERRACEEADARLGARSAARAPLPALSKSDLQREFAAAKAKRRENDPSVRPPRTTDCQLANITNCAVEDSTWKLTDNHGMGALQVLRRRITGEELEPVEVVRTPGVFAPAEIHDLPPPMK